MFCSVKFNAHGKLIPLEEISYATGLLFFISFLSKAGSELKG